MSAKITLMAKYDTERYYELDLGGTIYRVTVEAEKSSTFRDALDAFAADNTDTDLINHSGVTAV